MSRNADLRGMKSRLPAQLDFEYTVAAGDHDHRCAMVPARG
jgi:hypothetical protein